MTGNKHILQYIYNSSLQQVKLHLKILTEKNIKKIYYYVMIFSFYKKAIITVWLHVKLPKH